MQSHRYTRTSELGVQTIGIDAAFGTWNGAAEEKEPERRAWPPLRLLDYTYDAPAAAVLEEMPYEEPVLVEYEIES